MPAHFASFLNSLEMNAIEMEWREGAHRSSRGEPADAADGAWTPQKGAFLEQD